MASSSSSTANLDSSTRDALYCELRQALKRFEDRSCPAPVRATAWATATKALEHLEDERSLTDVLTVAHRAIDGGDEESVLLALSAIAGRLPPDCAPLLRLGDRACSKGLLEVVHAVGRELRRRNLRIPADWGNVLIEDGSRDWGVSELLVAPEGDRIETVVEPPDPEPASIPWQRPRASTESWTDDPTEPLGAAVVHPIKTVLHETFDCIAKANARGARITGTPTGFDSYDRLTSGLHDGELTVIAARPGMGRTSFVLNLAANVASVQELVSAHDPAERWQEPGQGVLVFSLGLSRRQAVTRMLCSEARFDLGKVRAGILAKRDWEQLTLAAGRLAALRIWVNDTPDLSSRDIRWGSARLQAEFDRFDLAGKRTQRFGLIVIDGCHRVQGGRRALRRLRDIARELMVPIIATIALDPLPDGRDGGNRPQLSDLPLSDDDADNVCLIHRDGYYDCDADPNVAELIIASQCNGPTDTVKLRWEPQFGRFENLPEGEHGG